MDSKFKGTWVDESGTEEDPSFHAPSMHVKFTDDGEDLTAALGEAGTKIHWSNNTIWTKVG
jgi:hypothetical protein